MMKKYYRIMAGKKSMHAEDCIKGHFIGVDYGIQMDLSHEVDGGPKAFREKLRPIFLELHPGKTKVSAGLACGALWTIAHALQPGDIVLCPNGSGSNLVGEITGPYQYVQGEILPHRRDVRWYSQTIDRSEMSELLQSTTTSWLTICDISKHAQELERLISGSAGTSIVTNDETIEDPIVFALEKHLEEFLVKNWQYTELGKQYDIFEEDGELAGQQYQVDTGNIDILAISKDKKELLVVELKKGRASDAVIGQILRYMGYVQDELLESGQTVKGIIIAMEDDQRIRRALSQTQNIDFYKYKVSFKLIKN